MLFMAVVDDNCEFRAKFVSLLNGIRSEDDIVHDYSSGDSFLEAFKLNHFDLVFLDAQMPGIGGLDVMKELRDISQSTLIVVVTNHIDYAPDFFPFDVFRFILKPPNKPVLRRFSSDVRTESEM